MVKKNPLLAILPVLMISSGLIIWISQSSGKMRESLAQVNTQAAVESQSRELPSPRSYNRELEITSTASSTLLPPTSTPTPTPISSATLIPSSIPTLMSEEIQVIGYSVEGRPLEIHKFGSGETSLMIVAGIHGGYEWNTVSLGDELIKALEEEKVIVPDDKTLFILRVLNPDGYERDRGPDGRANANNVDINRNWDANWQANWYGTHCWNYRIISAGTEPMSEPETKALAQFIEESHIKALISYHSAALGIFSGGWPTDQASIDLANELSQVSPYSYPPVATDCIYTGQLIDWASEKGIAAVDVELTNHVDIDLSVNLKILKTFLDWHH